MEAGKFIYLLLFSVFLKVDQSAEGYISGILVSI